MKKQISFLLVTITVVSLSCQPSGPKRSTINTSMSGKEAIKIIKSDTALGPEVLSQRHFRYLDSTERKSPFVNNIVDAITLALKKRGDWMRNDYIDVEYFDSSTSTYAIHHYRNDVPDHINTAGIWRYNAINHYLIDDINGVDSFKITISKDSR